MAHTVTSLDRHLDSYRVLLEKKAGNPAMIAEIWQRINYVLDKRNELTRQAAWAEIVKSY